jgi:hypothetical protein
VKKLLLILIITLYGCENIDLSIPITDNVCRYRLHKDPERNICWATGANISFAVDCEKVKGCI